MRYLTIVFGMVLATAGSAQDGMRPGDTVLSQDELTAYLSGQVLSFYNDGLATYRADGGYDYRYSADGERVMGTYQVLGDGQVCTDFVNGFSRCDYIVQDGGRHVMIIDNGDRYPVKSRTAIE